MMYRYSDNPPKGYTAYESSPNSSKENYIYYAPQEYGRTPTKAHTRRPSYNANTSRPAGGWHTPAGYPSPKFYEAVPNYHSPPVKVDVSATKSRKSKVRSFSISGGRGFSGAARTQKQFIYVDDSDDAKHSPRYEYREPKQSKPKRFSKPSADQYFYFPQEPAYEAEPKRTRTRRSSTNTRSPQKPAKTSYSRPPVKATEADAAREGIPSGYSIKNWDPTESPIILLGSVFDANSLGKWIYDWTVYHHGASTPMADVAGDLWLLLIKLAGKMKRAEECIRRIRSRDSRDMVEDFIESGSRLWQKFKQLLKECERFMWKAAKREGGKGVSMGKNAGTEFVESIFGRDRELETTERIMNNIRLWNMRFDANCEDILRRPSAI